VINMGDRISFSFKDRRNESVAFFAHWSGMSMLESVEEYYKQLMEWIPEDNSTYPLYRLEPETVMTDFILWFFAGRWDDEPYERVYTGYYLGKDHTDGDNSDNGHFVFDLEKGIFV